jgi:O-antigen ligase
LFRAIYLFLIIFPFLVIPYDQYITVMKMGLLAYLSLSIWIMIFLKWYRQKMFPFEKKLYPPELFLIAFAVWATLSACLSNHPYIVLFGMIKRHEGLLALYSYFTIFFITLRFAPIEKYKSLLTGLVGMSIIAGIYGVLQKFPLYFLLPDPGRVESFFGNANFFGSYLEIMLLAATVLMLLAKSRKEITLFILIADLLFLNTLYTGTRSALIGILAGVLFFSVFILKNSQNRLKRYIWLLFTFFIIFGIVNAMEGNVYLLRVFSIADSAKQALHNDGDAGSYRWKIWQLALPLVGKYPLFGSGPDTLAYVFNQGAFRNFIHVKDALVDKAHNEYLQISITMGIPALLFYLGFLMTVLRSIWKAIWKSSGEKQLLLAGFFAILIGYIVQAFFNISVVPVAPFFWFMLGMAYRLSYIEIFAIESHTHMSTIPLS